VTALERELERIDEQLLDLIKRRVDLDVRIEESRMDSGTTRFSHARELAVVRRYARLGAAGPEVALLLLRLTRRTLARREDEQRAS
jgi:chorismate mutase